MHLLLYPSLYRRARAGFTLVELLTVICIIGILAGILIPIGSIAVKKARDSKTKVQLNNLVLMAESYHDAYKIWPTFNPTPVVTEDTAFQLKIVAPRFVHIMTANPDQGDAIYNKQGIQFATFKDSDLSNDPNSITPIDAFGNDDLWLVYNTNISTPHTISPNVVNQIALTPLDGNALSITQDPNIPINEDCVALSPGQGVSVVDIITTWDVKPPGESDSATP